MSLVDRGYLSSYELSLGSFPEPLHQSQVSRSLAVYQNPLPWHLPQSTNEDGIKTFLRIKYTITTTPKNNIVLMIKINIVLGLTSRNREIYKYLLKKFIAWKVYHNAVFHRKKLTNNLI